MTPRRTLILGWGNPGRRDDGLGPALAEALAGAEGPALTVDSGYQLQVEDAADLARHERVLFVDADRAGGEPFSLRRLEPAPMPASFSSHSVSPGQLLALAHGLYGAAPEAWLMGIRGYEFDEFGEGLSARARANLAAAVGCVRAVLCSGAFQEFPPSRSRRSEPRPAPHREVEHA